MQDEAAPPLVMTPSSELLKVLIAGPDDMVADVRGSFEQAMKLVHANGARIQCMHLRVNEDVPSEGTDIVMIAVSHATWARARHSEAPGPQPVRSSVWPWGFPWLGEPQRAAVEDSNAQILWGLKLLHTARDNNPAAILCLYHPEDLGMACRGRPASLWQLREVRSAARSLQLFRMATWQCRFGKASHPSPLGILCSETLRSPLMHKGWPQFADSANARYQGPLPEACGCGATHPPRTNERMSHSQFESSLLTPAFRDWLCLRLIKAAACQRGLLRKGLNKAASASATTDDIGNSSEADSDTTWHWEVSDFEEEDCEEEESPKDAVGESRPTILEDMQYVDKLKLDFNEDTETMMENPSIFKNKAAIWVVSAKSAIIQVGIGKNPLPSELGTAAKPASSRGPS